MIMGMNKRPTKRQIMAAVTNMYTTPTCCIHWTKVNGMQMLMAFRRKAMPTKASATSYK
jgi:hypothetical protein